jgi:hypothetical protein
MSFRVSPQLSIRVFKYISRQATWHMVYFCFVWFILGGATASIVCAQQLAADGVQVTIKSVTAFNGNHGESVYEVALHYRADRRVIVAGLKAVTGEGDVTYLTKDRKLVLADAASGAKIAEYTLHTTAVPAGNADKDLPDPSDFTTYRTFETGFSNDEQFESAVNSVLNRYFTQGLWPQTNGKPCRNITTFRGLENLPWPFVGRVAIQIEYPVETSPKHQSFRMWWTAEEGRVGGSAWIKASSRQVLTPASAFVDRLIQEITKP